MQDHLHPSQFMPARLTDSIRAHAGESEVLKRLNLNQLSMIFEQGWLKMFVPKNLGGLELSLPEGVRLEEALSWSDGSVGWVVTLSAGAAWFVGFLDQQLMSEIFADNKVLFAGSGAPTGTAELTVGGYKVSGYWRYASGSIHATVLTANCTITQGGKPLVDEAGTPVVKPFLFKRDEVTLHTKWNSMGMIATGSHDFEVKQVLVPETRAFHIDSRHAVLPQAIYQYPFLQLAESTLAVNLSGMAVRFLDLCESLFGEQSKQRPGDGSREVTRRHKLAVEKEKLNTCRGLFYRSLDDSWMACNSGNEIPSSMLNEVSSSSRQLADQSRRLVDELYPYCGLTAANTTEEINRVWRNLHTASQHRIFTA